MQPTILLASSSSSRQQLLRAAGVPFSAHVPRVDEDAVRSSLQAEHARARDIADTLAEMKAVKIAERYPEACVIGADQVLECDGQVFGKPGDLDVARRQLRALRGRVHLLHSAVVVCHQARPVWRHVETARLTMRSFSDSYLEDYLTRNWESAQHSVGCYKIEEEGIRLFSQVHGDHFTILGMPLVQLLDYLSGRNFIEA